MMHLLGWLLRSARADACGISLRPASNVVLLPGRTRLTVARRLKPSRASDV